MLSGPPSISWMSSLGVFDQRAREYDEWYEKHRLIYLSELEAVKHFRCRRGLEIGVGTGRFAEKTGVVAGLDPSIEMLKLAPSSVHLVQGVGEALPFRSRAFDCSLLIITLCFVDDPVRVLEESSRVSERLIVCMVPRESAWGKLYSELARKGHPFYSHARFYSVEEVVEMASRVGLKRGEIVSTLSYPPRKELFEEPRKVSAREAENFGFTCIEFRR